MKKILVKGPAASMSGYGEHTRLILNALREDNDTDLYLMNIKWGQTGNLTKDTEEKRWIEKLMLKTNEYFQNNKEAIQSNTPIFDISVQVTIPNEWEKIAKRNIGITAGIEVDRITHQWIEKSQLVDKIIVPSHFAKQGFDKTVYEMINNKTGEKVEVRCQKDVEVIPYPVKDLSVSSTFDKNFFDKIKTQKNFLAIAQWSPRKDLETSIRGFLEEFHDEEVGLIIKTNITNNSVIDRNLAKEKLDNLISEFPSRKCTVYLLHGNLDRTEMNSLYTNEKVLALVSTTHGEGYGLPLFEAAYNGLPVIAPRWSGHVDFLSMSHSGKEKYCALAPKYSLAKVAPEVVWDGVIKDDSQWCYVDKDSYKESLRKVLSSNYGAYKKRSKKLSENIRNTHSKENVYKKIIASIKQ